MKRLTFPLLLLVLAVPGAANAAACSPLNCAPSQFLVAHGTLLATRGGVDRPLRVIDLGTGATRWRLPAGVVAGDTLVSRSPALLTWFDLATGRRLQEAPVQLHGAFELVGTSQDGSRAVLSRSERKATTFAILKPGGTRLVGLRGGNWEFDALRGDRLVLIRYGRSGYQVRLFDLARNVLVATPLKSPGESAVIDGLPLARVASANGRYLFTLYVDQNGDAMIHELDLRKATARCIDLPGSGDFGAALTYGIAVRGSTLWAVSPGYGRVVAIDVAAQRVRESFGFVPNGWTQNAGMAALSPDGARLAITDAQHVWVVDLGARRVHQLRSHVAIALAFSSDGRRLYGIGERSKLFSLRVNR